MGEDRRLTSLPDPVDLKHHALQIPGRLLIMAPHNHGGYASVLEVRAQNPGADLGVLPVDLDAIADLICRHLDERAALLPRPPSRAAWDPNSSEEPT